MELETGLAGWLFNAFYIIFVCKCFVTVMFSARRGAVRILGWFGERLQFCFKELNAKHAKVRLFWKYYCSVMMVLDACVCLGKW